MNYFENCFHLLSVFQELMISLGKTYRDVFQAVYWGSGLIEEAKHILKNQTMIDGMI